VRTTVLMVLLLSCAACRASAAATELTLRSHGAEKRRLATRHAAPASWAAQPRLCSLEHGTASADTNAGDEPRLTPFSDLGFDARCVSAAAVDLLVCRLSPPPSGPDRRPEHLVVVWGSELAARSVVRLADVPYEADAPLSVSWGDLDADGDVEIIAACDTHYSTAGRRSSQVVIFGSSAANADVDRVSSFQFEPTDFAGAPVAGEDAAPSSDAPDAAGWFFERTPGAETCAFHELRFDAPASSPGQRATRVIVPYRAGLRWHEALELPL